MAIRGRLGELTPELNTPKRSTLFFSCVKELAPFRACPAQDSKDSAHALLTLALAGELEDSISCATGGVEGLCMTRVPDSLLTPLFAPSAFTPAILVPKPCTS